MILDTCQDASKWFAEAAKDDRNEMPLVFLFSQTLAEDSEIITDVGYFVSYWKPKESKDGKLKVVLCRQTITYARETNGDAGAVWDTKMEVIGSIECQGFRTPPKKAQGSKSS